MITNTDLIAVIVNLLSHLDQVFFIEVETTPIKVDPLVRLAVERDKVLVLAKPFQVKSINIFWQIFQLLAVVSPDAKRDLVALPFLEDGGRISISHMIVEGLSLVFW